jgi:hypothetical protein
MGNDLREEAPLTRPAAAPDLTGKRPPHARSAISNGSKLPGGVSASSPEGRRYRDVVHDLTAELGGTLTAAEQLQVSTIAGLVVHAERLQGEMLRGEAVDTEQLTRVSNSAARLLNALRKKVAVQARRPAGAEGLRAYLAEKASRA